MIKCTQCNKDNLDDMKYCGYCGSLLVRTLEEKTVKTEKKPLNLTILMAAVGVVLVAVISIVAYLNSSPYKYSVAKKVMLEGNYALAAEKFEAIKDYKDSEELYTHSTYNNAVILMESGQYESAQAQFSKISSYEDAEKLSNDCIHLIAVQNDVTAPTISGLETNTIIEAKYEEPFNFLDYIHNTISVVDDVSGEITEYNIATTSDVYDAATGDVDTAKAGEYSFTISVTDEAGNKSSIDVVVKIDNTIYVTEENSNPTLCDNEEFGTYTLKSLLHGRRNGVSGYIWDIDIQNNYSDTIYTYIGVCYINDYKVESYYSIDSIATNKMGTMTSYIYDEDLDEKTSEFEFIEATFVIKRYEQGFASMDETIFSRPVVIYKSAFN